ncbi:MAG: glycosyltransferase [Flavobacteriales bacterium]
MHILIVHKEAIPVQKYGGTERVIWYLGQELVKMGHKVTYLVKQGSQCPFARVLYLDPNRNITEQIPDTVDIVHFSDPPNGEVKKPYIRTVHGNSNDLERLDINSVFVSQNHAARYGSASFVYNGMNWDDYGDPALSNPRRYFHFLGNAAWRLKNVKGAVQAVTQVRGEKLHVLGGRRLNFNMGFRFTLNPRVRFHGMVGNERKNDVLRGSKGLVFPVRWHEPFGIAIIESLYFGCPVFGTPYGSLPELVTKETGFLSGSSEELSAAIRDSAKFSRKECHAYAVENFNARRTAEAYLQKYETVLNGRTLNAQAPQLLKVQEEKFLAWE